MWLFLLKMQKYKVDVVIAKGQSHFLCRKRFDRYFTRELTDNDPKMEKLRNVINNGGKERADWKIRSCRCPFYKRRSAFSAGGHLGGRPSV